ncbi:MAG TPA: GNAT family N-acetyltransferase [Bacteroidia bacterium]|nr:GNAT family N-acetyltransferase [Bacteroidia bacterium]
MRLREPTTPQDFENYYQLRWEVLRKPWNQAKGTEKDDAEESSIHIMALNDADECIGVSRLQFNSPEEAQVRFMGVRDDQQGKGVGKKLMHYLEEKAKKNGAKKIILQARENAVPFYLSIGYKKTEKTFLLWGMIQHYKMEKEI